MSCGSYSPNRHHRQNVDDPLDALERTVTKVLSAMTRNMCAEILYPKRTELSSFARHDQTNLFADPPRFSTVP